MQYLREALALEIGADGVGVPMAPGGVAALPESQCGELIQAVAAALHPRLRPRFATHFQKRRCGCAPPVVELTDATVAKFAKRGRGAPTYSWSASSEKGLRTA